MTFRHLHDSHRGETCIVIGNGPSLRNVPKEFFAKYPTFGCNHIYKLPYIPDFYAVVDKFGIEQDWDALEAVPSPVKFVREGCNLSGYPLHCIPRREFSLQPNVWVWHQSATFVMLQVAYYLGFAKILLVGVDHRWVIEGNPDPKVPRLITKDINHFCEDYLAGRRVTYPKKDLAELAFRLAKQQYEDAGRTVINLTEGSALDVFERGELRDYL